jgi:hypothetical protein
MSDMVGAASGGETFKRFLPHAPSSNVPRFARTGHASLARSLRSVSVSSAP